MWLELLPPYLEVSTSCLLTLCQHCSGHITQIISFNPELYANWTDVTEEENENGVTCPRSQSQCRQSRDLKPGGLTRHQTTVLAHRIKYQGACGTQWPPQTHRRPLPPPSSKSHLHYYRPQSKITPSWKTQRRMTIISTGKEVKHIPHFRSQNEMLVSWFSVIDTVQIVSYLLVSVKDFNLR